MAELLDENQACAILGVNRRTLVASRRNGLRDSDQSQNLANPPARTWRSSSRQGPSRPKQKWAARRRQRSDPKTQPKAKSMICGTDSQSNEQRCSLLGKRRISWQLARRLCGCIRRRAARFPQYVCPDRALCVSRQALSSGYAIRTTPLWPTRLAAMTSFSMSWRLAARSVRRRWPACCTPHASLFIKRPLTWPDAPNWPRRRGASNEPTAPCTTS